MPIDYLDYAHKLRVNDVFAQGNPTGIVTDPRLYTPRQNPDGTWQVPPWRGGVHVIKHITVGTNSLSYLAGGSIAAGLWTSAHYLVPTDDYTVHKLIPQGKACNHVGPSEWPLPNGDNWLNSNSYGIEVENIGDGGVHPITESQYIKAALITAYVTALDHIRNFNIRDHGLVAQPFGRRTDPWAGGFDDAKYFGHLWEIRKRPEIFAFWGVPQWSG